MEGDGDGTGSGTRDGEAEGVRVIFKEASEDCRFSRARGTRYYYRTVRCGRCVEISERGGLFEEFR